MKPYLSIVLPARNDEYVEDIFSRIETSLRVLTEQIEENKLPTEIIVVDWNTPPARTPLAKAIKWPKLGSFCQIRVIQVPPEIHQTYQHWDKRGVHVVVAENVGFRRARGQFCVGKAMDCFWSENLVKFIAQRALKPGILYRCDRKEVRKDVLKLKDGGAGNILDYCERNVVRIQEKSLYQQKVGDFKIPILHTNACGDFQLMSLGDWHALRGYHETKNIMSLHVDSLLSFSAYAGGIKEQLLAPNCCVYKIEHGLTFNKRLKEKIPWLEKLVVDDWLPSFLHPKRTALLEFSKNWLGKRKNYINGAQVPTWEEFTLEVKDIVLGIKPRVHNTENWGWADKSLIESTIEQ